MGNNGSNKRGSGDNMVGGNNSVGNFSWLFNNRFDHGGVDYWVGGGENRGG